MGPLKSNKHTFGNLSDIPGPTLKHARASSPLFCSCILKWDRHYEFALHFQWSVHQSDIIRQPTALSWGVSTPPKTWWCQSQKTCATLARPLCNNLFPLSHYPLGLLPPFLSCNRLSMWFDGTKNLTLAWTQLQTAPYWSSSANGSAVSSFGHFGDKVMAEGSH